MRNWLVYLIEDPHREWARFLGRVRAAHRSDARKAAIAEFELDERDQAKLYVDSSKPFSGTPEPPGV